MRYINLRFTVSLCPFISSSVCLFFLLTYLLTYLLTVVRVCIARRTAGYHVSTGPTVFAALALIPGRGEEAGHRPNPFQVAPEASRIGCEGVSWPGVPPGVPPGVIMGRTLEHQMLDRLVGAVAVRADGRVPVPDTVKVSRHQWAAQICACQQCAGNRLFVVSR